MDIFAHAPLSSATASFPNLSTFSRNPTIYDYKTRSSLALKTKLCKRAWAFTDSPPGPTSKHYDDNSGSTLSVEECYLFDRMKERFLSFKRHIYMKNLEHFQNLSKSQCPMFMVIACADSRVCPSNILGFEPGEAFIVRNVANMVPPFESGPSETNAALEFAINHLKVRNVIVIGHSRCGGIRALMSTNDSLDTSFMGSWINNGMMAKSRTLAKASHLSFDQQCGYCEKESINSSLLNLMRYPWIEAKVRSGEMAIHGGYYDIVACSFEKWTLLCNFDKGISEIAIKNRALWS